MDPTSQRLVMGAAGAANEKLYVEDVFSTFLYTGNGSTQTITNGIDLAGKGGLVWIKRRDLANGHLLVDTTRGATKGLGSNSTTAEFTDANSLTAFNANGFSLGTSYNASLATFTSWTFRKAPKFFDVVTYTGDGTAGKTISHTLDSVPGCIIIKSTSDVDAWRVYHRSAASNPETVGLVLNNAGSRLTASSFWNDTAPISTHFTVGTNGSVNASGQTYVAYLFANDAGGFGNSGNDSVVKCGSYAGTGGAGLFVDLGWEPQFVLIKAATTTGNWWMSDNMRGFTSNGAGVATTAYLTANTLDGESTFAIACNSTGFTIQTTGTSINAAGNTYIYIAIRRGPMKTPTSATSVFATEAVTPSTGNSFTTGFPVDLSIANSRTAGQIGYFQDRLRRYPTVSSTAGNYPLLVSTNTNAESNYNDYGPFIYASDSNTSIRYGINLDGLSNVTYAFRRAPGFFDVVAYAGNGNAFGQNVSHNLGIKPELAIIKCRNVNAGVTDGWWVGHKDVNPFNGSLQTSDAWNTYGYIVDIFSSTTSTLLVGGSGNLSTSGRTYIAYLFATCPGVSKVGSYTGTGTTLNVDCGFTNGARFVLIKRTDSTGDWYVWDTARGIVSGNDPYLLLNSTAAEVTNTDYIDPLSSGFQISSTAPAAINANGGSFIFLAIA